MAEALPDALRVLCPSDLAFVRPVRKMVEALLASQGWPEDAVEDAGLVFTEMLQNAIEHGSRADGRETVRTVARLAERAIVLEVHDPGTGKDPRDVLRRDVTVPPPTDAARGRGLFLIHRMSTAFERRIDGDGGLSISVRMEEHGS